MAKHVYNVKMSCSGCSGAVSRVLGKVGSDIQQVDIDMEKQTVTVTTDLDKDIVLSHIKKSGKECSYVGEA